MHPGISFTLLMGEVPSLDAFPFAKIAFATLLVTLSGMLLFAIVCFASNKKRTPVKRQWLSRLLYVAFFVTTVVLAATSFQAVLAGAAMSEYALMAHVGAAGAFTFLLLAVAWLYLPHVSIEGEFRSEHRWWFARLSSWLLVGSALVAATTMFLSMLPVLDTSSLAQALTWHRYAGLITAAACMMHVTAIVVTRLGLR